MKPVSMLFFMAYYNLIQKLACQHQPNDYYDWENFFTIENFSKVVTMYLSCAKCAAGNYIHKPETDDVANA